MKRIWVLPALAVLLFAGCAKKPASEAAVGADRKLETAKVEQSDAAGAVEIDGTVVGATAAVLSSRLAAPVVEVRAVPGQSVRAGTLLVRLEERESDSALESARAAVAAARSRSEISTRNRMRFERLEGRGAATAVELERARQEEASALSALALAQAAVARAETDRGQSVLVAPFDAIVVEKMVSVGDLTAPGRPLVRLSSAKGRRVEAAPGEEAAARLAVGDAVPVVLGDRVVEGRIVEIVGAVDPETRRRIVRVGLPADVEPAVGSFARLRFPGPAGIEARGARARDRGAGRPRDRLGGRPRRPGVPAIRPDGGACRGNGLVEVRSGLEAGDGSCSIRRRISAAGTRAVS